MGRRQYFRQRLFTIAGGGTFDEVIFDPRRESSVYHVTRFAVEDETSAPLTDIRVYVGGRGTQHWLVEENSPAAGVLYWDSDGVVLTEPDTLVARFTGATVNDVLRLYVEGWIEDVEVNA